MLHNIEIWGGSPIIHSQVGQNTLQRPVGRRDKIAEKLDHDSLKMIWQQSLKMKQIYRRRDQMSESSVHHHKLIQIASVLYVCMCCCKVQRSSARYIWLERLKGGKLNSARQNCVYSFWLFRHFFSFTGEFPLFRTVKAVRRQRNSVHRVTRGRGQTPPGCKGSEIKNIENQRHSLFPLRKWEQ